MTMMQSALILLLMLPLIYAPAPNVEQYCDTNENNSNSNNKHNFLKPSLSSLSSLSLSSLSSLSSNDNNHCNIPIVYITNDSIIDPLPEYPVIYKYNTIRNSAINKLLQRDFLLKNYGHVNISLTSSNTYSHGFKVLTVNEYINNIVDNNDTNSHSNETYYFFGGNYDGLWKEIASLYESNVCKGCTKAGAVTLGIGGMNSGVAFHFHGPGFSESIIGSKRWFLYPPNKEYPEIDPNITVADWVKFHYDDWRKLSDSYECIIRPNEVLFFPSNWMHATLNLDKYNAFVSLFLDVGLI